jgi:uncharacterized Zn ribbon protein
MENHNIPRKAVEDSEGSMIKAGDHVRHLSFGRDAIVKAAYTAVRNGIRYNEISIIEPGGHWNPKDVRKL